MAEAKAAAGGLRPELVGLLDKHLSETELEIKRKAVAPPLPPEQRHRPLNRQSATAGNSTTAGYNKVTDKLPVATGGDGRDASRARPPRQPRSGKGTVFSPKPDHEEIARVADKFLRAAARLRHSKVVDQWEYQKLVRDTFAEFLAIAESSGWAHRSEGVEWARDHVRSLIAKEVDLLKSEKSDLLPTTALAVERLMTSELDAAVQLAHGPHHLVYDGIYHGSHDLIFAALNVRSYFRGLMRRIRGAPRIRLVPGNFSAIISPSDHKSVLVANSPITDSTPGIRRTNQFRREGKVWSISYGGEKVSLPNSYGLGYIAQLLRMPGKSIPCTNLEEFSIAKRPSYQSAVVMDFEPQDTMDNKAETQYKARAKELVEQIADARARGDTGKAAHLTQELEFIEEHLTANTGRRGRRRAFSGPSERARVRVTNAIDRAIKELEECAPKMAAHLRANIRTGKLAVYQDQTTAWKT